MGSIVVALPHCQRNIGVMLSENRRAVRLTLPRMYGCIPCYAQGSRELTKCRTEKLPWVDQRHRVIG